MKWLLLFLCSVWAQPSLPLLPSGVTIDMVKQIQVTSGGTVEFIQSTDNSSTITNRLSYPPIIKFDNSTGILTVQSATMNGSSILKPGLVAAFLAVLLCALNSNNKQQGAVLMLLTVGLGVASAGVVVADLTIRVPGCFHTEGANGNVLVFDQTCRTTTMTTFQASAKPLPGVQANLKWTPITPATAFLPVNDHGQHYLTPAEQYEVWKQNFGHADNDVERQNFYAFTESCRIQNMNPNRTWTAACNQFAHLSHGDWKSQVLSNNAQAIADAEAKSAGRRLLSNEKPLFSEISPEHHRKLLQSGSFSWVGTGKLTPVKDQGQCGSCYAHSSSSQMEAALAIATNTVPVPLAREQLKDCSSGSPGCNGGVPAYMFQYAKAGLGTDAAYPYVTSNAGCRSLPAVAYKNNGYKTISNSENAFATALQSAPIAVTVCADTWNNYAGGVLDNCQSNCNVDHAVLLVGYGTDATLGDYWLIQNSWATWWGESGFIRLKRNGFSASGTGGMCGLTVYPGYQADTPSGGSGASVPGAVDCQGYWSAWSGCSASCGGGTQSQTWTTTQAPSNGGAACPTTQNQQCNTNLCPTDPNVPVTPTNYDCLHLSNTVLGGSGDGDYNQDATWNEGWCGATANPQYTLTNSNGEQMALFFFATNCRNNVIMAGQWGLGPAPAQGLAYQWSFPLPVSNNVIPSPTLATGWTIQFSACS